jgi:hypothetical protein
MFEAYVSGGRKATGRDAVAWRGRKSEVRARFCSLRWIAMQGERRALEFEDFEEWIARFSAYPLVQLIDLDGAMAIGEQKLVFAIDSRQGRVAIRGSRELTTITPLEMIESLESFSGAFLYTHIDTEGLMQGIPMDTVRSLRASTRKQLIVAGESRALSKSISSMP